MIKYIGSKKKIIPHILRVVSSLSDVSSVVDIFSGSSRVGHALKREGYRVISNDLGQFAHVIAIGLVQASDSRRDDASSLIEELNKLEGKVGYFTETFCNNARFFQPKNGMKVDRIREEIELLDVDFEMKCVLLTSLIEAADRVDSTVGLQATFLREWAPRSFRDLVMKVPDLLQDHGDIKCVALNEDALELASRVKADVVYVDPPYNQHSYANNYHIWDTLVKWDHPQHKGKACRRIDVSQNKSVFNDKKRAVGAMRDLVSALDVPYIIVSFNDRGFISTDEITEILRERGDVHTENIDHPQHISAMIALKDKSSYTPKSNKEYIFTCHTK